MEDSTLRPTPSYNANIPVVTAAGGTNVAYKDPNSPESILKKTTELNAQVVVDTKFDVATSPYYEGFVSCKCGCHTCPHCRKQTTNLQLLLFVTIVLFVTVISLDKLTNSARLFLVTLCVILVILCLTMYRH
jgi:hypothetical protein